jgi:hypothetical protein
MSLPVKSRFAELLQLRLPRGTNTALDELASKLHRSKIVGKESSARSRQATQLRE